MTKEEQDRQVESGEQLDGTSDVHRQSDIPRSSISNENKVIERAEREAHKTEVEGAGEDPQRDRTLSAVRSPSADRNGGITGATLPVVEEDGEANSREDSLKDEKASGVPRNAPLPIQHQLPATTEKDNTAPSHDQSTTDQRLLSLPNFNRLSMGLQPNASTGKEG